MPSSTRRHPVISSASSCGSTTPEPPSLTYRYIPATGNMTPLARSSIFRPARWSTAQPTGCPSIRPVSRWQVAARPRSPIPCRSEERRVGKECRKQGSREHEKKTREREEENSNEREEKMENKEV